MAISANSLVSLSPRVLSGGSSDLETNGLLLTTSALIPSGTPALKFTSASSVKSYFGEESAEANFATQYFTGVTNQQKAISTLWIGRRFSTASAGWLRSGPITTTLEDFKKVTKASFKISVGGTEKEITETSLASCTSLSAVATAIASAIGSCTGTYNASLNCFIFTTTATGATATLSFASAPASSTATDVSELMSLTADTGAVLSDGKALMTASANMNAICQVSLNWVGFTTCYSATEDEAKALAEWADIDDDFVYFDWTTDSKVTSALTNESTKPKALQSYNCVACIYGDQQDAALFLAIGASIDWTRNQGIKTWFGKQTSGLNARVVTEEASTALDDLRCNYIGEYACRNSDFILINRGYLANSFYGFIDVLYGMIWFKSKIQTSVMDGFTSVNRVPYNDQGYAMIEAWLIDPIVAAKKCGVIDTGMSFSASQRQQMIQETSFDLVPDLVSKGYWYQIEDPEASVRAERGTPVITIYYSYGGSVQKFSAPITTVI